jgi:hypothetical protein
MSTRPDLDRSITAWLAAEAPERASERLLAVSRERIRTTRQRRSLGPARRLPAMNSALKMAIAAAAVVVVAIAGISLLPRGGVGGPAPIPTPTVTPIPTPTPAPTPIPSPRVISQFPLQVLEPGRYMTDASDEPVVPAGIMFTVPPGWYNQGWAIEKGDVDVSFWTVGNTYRDPCKSASTALNPPLGPTVEDFVTALGQQTGTHVISTTPVTLDGHSGQLVELDWPAGIDVSTCEDGDLRLWVALGTGDPSRSGGMGRHSTLWIIDVDGLRTVVEVTTLPTSVTDAQRSEARTIVESIKFSP